METLEKLRNGIDQLPKWLLLVLVIFVDGLVGALYRAAGKTTEAKVIGWIMAAAYVLSILLLDDGIRGMADEIYNIAPEK